MEKVFCEVKTENNILAHPYGLTVKTEEENLLEMFTPVTVIKEECGQDSEINFSETDATEFVDVGHTINELKKEDTLPDNNDGISEETGNKHVCSICGLSYNRAGRLTEHMLTHIGLKCKDCNKVFKGYSALRYHKSSVHKGNTFTCVICGTTLRGQSTLIKHRKTNACMNKLNRMNVFCECGKGFKNQKCLTFHKKNKHQNQS